MAAPAMAFTIVAGPYKNMGQCMRVVKYFDMAERNDDFTGWGTFSRFAYSDMGCEEVGDNWYIAVY